MEYQFRERKQNNQNIQSAISGMHCKPNDAAKTKNVYRIAHVTVKTNAAIHQLEQAAGSSENTEKSGNILVTAENAAYYGHKLHQHKVKKAARKEQQKRNSFSAKQQTEYDADEWEWNRHESSSSDVQHSQESAVRETHTLRTRQHSENQWDNGIRQRTPFELRTKPATQESASKEQYIQEAKKAAAKKSQQKAAKKASEKTASSAKAAAAEKTIGKGNLILLLVAFLLLILIGFTAILICICGSQAEEEERKRQNASSTTASVSDAVLQYAPLITQYANDNGIGRYVALLEAVMMQESGGMGVNVMQVDFASVSTVEESIQMGVIYFRTCLEMARVTSPEDIDHIKVALQGYNYGTGYITWVWRNYDGEYTPENAQLFSDNQKALLGWQIYGDPQYVDHVLRYYHYGESGGVEFITDGASFAWPVPGHTNITSGFGARWGTMHKGIDISDGNIQGVPVVASRAGTVTRADNACTHNYPKNSSCGCGGGYGNRVEISHGDGTSTLYGHMVTITVSVGQTVEQGQVIGYIGSTGHSTGYHLHFEIKQNGVQVDPMLYL